MIVGKVLEDGLLSVSEAELRDLGLQPGDQVSLEIKATIGPRKTLSRAEKKKILDETRGVWCGIPEVYLFKCR